MIYDYIVNVNVFILLLGIIFGFIIYNYFNKNMLYHGPNSNNIRKMVFVNKKNKKCYIFEPRVYMCPIF